MPAEIMAPAGGKEQLIAAVRCGAGAVYLGTQGFNARRNAENFDKNSLPEAAAYCHARGTKLYVTVNTVVTDDQLDALEEEADMIAASGVDAVIIQDMAVLRLFREKYPSLERFASTQTAVHNLDGALQLADMGFDRIVLARELSLKEMEHICANSPVSTEAFVHGAHCVSLSGACYLSSLIGGRSGNRGLCAQPCRLDFKLNGREYALSLKDMSLLDHVRQMESIGINALKIEGRMKRPEYVAAAVTACKQALAGEEYDLETLRSVFSRSGFSDGYLMGKRNANMFGYRRKEDVVSAEGVFSSLERLYSKETPRTPVSVHFTAYNNAPVSLTVSSKDELVTVTGPIPEAALNRPASEESVMRNLAKTGGTPFYISESKTEIDDGLNIPASVINDLRRRALDELLGKLEKAEPIPAEPWHWPVIKRHKAAEKPALWGRFAQPSEVVCEENFEKIIIPIEKLTADDVDRFGEKLVGELSWLMFPGEETRFEEMLTSLKAAGLKAIWGDNIYAPRIAKRLGLELHLGAGLNITNTQALDEYAKLGAKSATVSFELAMKNIIKLGGEIKRGIIAYGRLPLMRLRACPARGEKGCGGCKGFNVLTDRIGARFPLVCSERRYSTLLNSVSLHIAHQNLTELDHIV
ncbi:MAG: U32 family peptidase, partial [Oscillospiraceae bacterium]|nr:U32 family peptidase [Oscillospiraceae bacterium]